MIKNELETAAFSEGGEGFSIAPKSPEPTDAPKEDINPEMQKEVSEVAKEEIDMGYEPYVFEENQEMLQYIYTEIERIYEIKRELGDTDRGWYEGEKTKDELLEEYRDAIVGINIDFGRALGILPENVKDEDLANEAHTSFDDSIGYDFTSAVNVYGSVTLAVRVPFGRRYGNNPNLKGRDYLEISACKQGLHTALRLCTSVGFTQQGKVVFEANRTPGMGGNLDIIQTASRGREVTDIAHIPEKGVFSVGGHRYSEPSKFSHAVPTDILESVSLTAFFPSDPSQEYFNPFDRRVFRKHIDFKRVVEFFRSDGFDGEEELPEDPNKHAEFVEQFLC